jgi:hypothetical protein
MIIIGLLIAGVLKGQELIANAQVTSTVAQVKSIDAATSTFKDTYNGIPGDITDPDKRLPNCSAACVVGAGTANGDGHLENTPDATPIEKEGEAFFVQLNAAGLLSGITPAAAGSTALGANFPAAKISGNGFQAGSILATSDSPSTVIGDVKAPNGVYLTLTSTIGAQDADTAGLRPSQALRIDTKLDDATPDSGEVLAFGNGDDCGTATNEGVAGIYSSANNSSECGLYIRIQN